MKARSITRRKELRDDGSMVEISIWQFPEPLPPCAHSYQFRLAYVVAGVCVVRYDNECGKGDHRHIAGNEIPYRSPTSPGCSRISGGTWRTGN